MVKEIMEEIKKAETAGEQSLEDARFKAKYMVDNAKEECIKYKETAIAKQQKDAESMMKRAQDEGTKYASKVEDEAIKEKQDVIKLAESKESGAIKLVIDELIQ